MPRALPVLPTRRESSHLDQPHFIATIRRGLITAALGTLASQLLGVLLTYSATIALTRSTLPADYGLFSTVHSLVLLLALPATFGFDALLTRDLAIFRATGQVERMAGLLRRADQIGLLVSLILGGIAAALAVIVVGVGPLTFVVAIGISGLPLLVLSNLRRGALIGIGSPVVSQVPEAIVRPILFLLVVLVVSTLLRGTLEASTMVVADVGIYLTTLLLVARLLTRRLPAAVRAVTPIYTTSIWVRAALPLALLSSAGVAMMNLPIVLLGSTGNAQAAAHLTVAIRLASFVSFGLIAANVPLAPIIAQLWARGDQPGLQRILLTSARGAAVFAAIAAIGLIAIGPMLLALFGPSYVDALPALVILVIGQLVNVGVGSVGVLLIMTGHQRQATRDSVVAAILGAAVSVPLVIQLGLIGAALSSSLTLILLSTLWLRSVGHNLGLPTTLFGVRARTID